MKKISALLFIILFSTPAFSQFLNFGIKAGAESNTAPKYDISFISNGGGSIPGSGRYISAVENASWGFHGGIFTRIKIFSLYIQPEIVFASTSYEYLIGTGWSFGGEVKTQQFNRLSVPLLIGMQFGPFRINAGPAANVQIGTPKALIDDPNFKEMYKEAVWGLQAGIGVDILKKLTIDVRYAGSLGEKFGNQVVIGSEIYKLDHGQKSFLISLGLMF